MGRRRQPQAATRATHDSPAERFERLARECRAQDLKRLSLLGALVGSIGGLIHALQKERGTSSIFLAGRGVSFGAQRAERAADSAALEVPVREHLAHFGEQLAGTSVGARFYACGARAFRALDTLPALRARIAAQELKPEEAVGALSDVITHLFAVSFETADIAADPVTSRAIVALASLSQGKEHAGQERATAGAVFSRGRPDAAQRRRLAHLASAQDQAFQVFREFGAPQFVTALEALVVGNDWTKVARMRDRALALAADGATGTAVDSWYEVSTRRIDALKVIEDAMTTDLSRLCAQALSEPAASGPAQPASPGARTAAPIALLIADADPEVTGLGLPGGLSFHAGGGALPRPMRSLLDVLEAQSRLIGDVSSQLDAARAALAERKLIEKAKGLLMQLHRLSESDAYGLMREMAMRQNRRLVDVAAAVIAMAQSMQG